jgi:hypothetical protein
MPPPAGEASEDVAEDVVVDVADLAVVAPDLPRHHMLYLPNADNAGGTCPCYLIGTAHTSQTSADDVRTLILAVKPDVVMVELCRSRQSMLTMVAQKVPTMAGLGRYRPPHHRHHWYPRFLS